MEIGLPSVLRGPLSTVYRPSSIVHRLASAILFLLLSACTSVNMARQPRVDPLEASGVFVHEQSAQPALEGVISRASAAELDPLHTGLEDGELVQENPLEVGDELLARGAEQYEIYCAPCHDRAGNGAGAVVQRGFPAPPSLHEERLRSAPDGHFFEVITNGSGVMFSYASSVDVLDRWAIIAHIRRLQQAQEATE